MTAAEIARLQKLVESVTCDTCYYAGRDCDGKSGTIGPCDQALKQLDAARIDAEVD